ncbi:MAG: ABC transporter ATP-binding protein [Evtepia sp.]|nr:ABC transporter ATP-binding protein [Evtepia sp.]
MIQIKNLKKIYRTKDLSFLALDNVSLSILPGESVAIMGKSGAGKTTLMNIIGCLDTFDRGSYRLDGTEVSQLPDAKLADIRNNKIGFVMQDFALLPHKSVLFNVILPMYFDKTPWREMKHRALDVLDKLEIADQKNKKVSQLSGGQKQRVAIARAIVKNPAVLLADEPTGALDSETGRVIMETLMERNREGITVIVVTHDPQVANYCKRKIIISDGKIVHDSAMAPSSPLA